MTHAVEALAASNATRRWSACTSALAPLLLLMACAGPMPTLTSSDRPVPGARGEVAGRNARVLVYLPRQGDTLDAVAGRFLGSPERAWQIADANGQRWRPLAGQPLVVPLAEGPALGVTADGAQAIPILCYHQFGPDPSKMVVATAQFEAQLDWLARNHYHVVRLSDVAAFLVGKKALPQHSVVLTIDDGYGSVHRHALPLLKKYGVPATLFLYTDFIGSGDALSWEQVQDLAESGLVDIQAHSKSHRNLIETTAHEAGSAAYRHSVDAELRQSRAAIEQRLGTKGIQVRHFAYPFGDANEPVLEAMQRQQYELGLTVTPGGNAFFAHPLMLRRTMIYGDHSLDDFKARLQVRRNAIAP
jgi:peptidoglycan/xylan/chitin deacetylase (PgdA/CDA1 family)